MKDIEGKIAIVEKYLKEHEPGSVKHDILMDIKREYERELEAQRGVY
jgi:hypothetical protein